MGREDISFDMNDDSTLDDILLEEEEKKTKKDKSIDKRRLIEDKLEKRRLQRNIDDNYFGWDDDF